MNPKVVFHDFDTLVRNQYDKYGLKYLEEIKIDGKDTLAYFHDVTYKKTTIHNINQFTSYDEFRIISADIKYFTGILYLLRPFMNNPLKERNHGIPTYMQNVYDKRYLSYVSVIPQLFYNFWDRIGDLLYCYFETGLKERDVFINRILDNIPEKYKQSDNYKNLLEIYATYIKPLLDQRKEIVHYQMVETATYWATFLEDEEKIQEFQERKEKFPDVYNECLKMSFEGFGCALKLIDELANK
ncbi:MAG: hypothetical protein HQ543_12205 [Bacteroidetes bacterium]|nr:hypothetical protein [Bacteroidota bacterium]